MPYPINPANNTVATVNGKNYIYNSTDNSWTPIEYVGNINVGNVIATGTLAANRLSINTLNLTSLSSVRGLLETVNVVATSVPSNINIDALSQASYYYTSNAVNNFSINWRGNSSTTLNSVMSNGQSFTSTIMVTNGSSAYYPTSYNVDNLTVSTVKYIGGGNITSGNANSLDIYQFTLIKTDVNTYTLLVSQTKFA
jgi:hypothetical protein